MSRIKIVTLTLFLVSCASSSNNLTTQKVALVDAVDGTPSVMRYDRLISLAVRSALDVEDTIITGPDDQIRFEFEDGTLVAAGHDTQLRIETFDEKSGELHLSSSGGAATVALGKVMKKNGTSYFRLTTAFGDIQTDSRTRFWLEHASGGDQLEVVLLELGSLRVSNKFGETTLTAPGEATSIVFSAPPSETRIYDDLQSFAFPLL